MTKNKTPACPYGHYFNTEKLSVCPICGTRAPSAQEAKRVTATPMPERGVISSSTPSLPQSQTIDIYSSAHPPVSSPPFEAGSAVSGTPVQAQPQSFSDEISLDTAKPAPFVSTSLQAAVDAVSSYSDAEDAKTIGILNSPADNEPVVGWLVCVKGKYFGQSYNLKTGNNSVGRSVEMDIHLAEEESISRYKHCVITFEPNDQVFFIQQGESSGLTYLNGDMVMLPVKMKSKDTIKIGQAEFLLIPLCVDGFRWEDYIN